MLHKIAGVIPKPIIFHNHRLLVGYICKNHRPLLHKIYISYSSKKQGMSHKKLLEYIWMGRKAGGNLMYEYNKSCDTFYMMEEIIILYSIILCSKPHLQLTNGEIYTNIEHK